MLRKQPTFLFPYLFSLIALALPISISAETSASPENPLVHIDKPSSSQHPLDSNAWRSITLRDTRGNQRALGFMAGQIKAKAVVLFSLSTVCDLTVKNLPEILRLESQYRDKGVLFVGVSAMNGDLPYEVMIHQHENNIPFIVLKDTDQKLIRAVGLDRAPQVAVFDGNLTKRYTGPISDQYSWKVTKDKAGEEYLRDALESVLQGKPVKYDSIPTDGCVIGSAKRAPNRNLTYNRDIAPIITSKCQICHRPPNADDPNSQGTTASNYPLTTYGEVSDLGDQIKERVVTKIMPPWGPMKNHLHNNRIAHDRSLSDEQIEKIADWVETGMKEDDPKDPHRPPPPVVVKSGWRVGISPQDSKAPQANEKYFVTPMDTKCFPVKKEGIVDYQYFIVKTNFPTDRWVSAAQIIPGDASVVHHAVAHITGPDRTPGLQKEEVGYIRQMKTLSELYNPLYAAILINYLPGEDTRVIRSGEAIRLPAGATITIEMHYTPNHKSEACDLTTLGLVFTEPPAREVKTNPMSLNILKIPANDPHAENKEEMVFTQDSELLSLQPHQHLRGKDFKYVLVSPDGKKEETLLVVQNFDFNWQTNYVFENPIPVAKGSKLKLTAHWDNSVLNPNNPDPSKSVKFGQQTEDEMMLGWVTYSIPRKN